jgi:arginine deiminase
MTTLNKSLESLENAVYRLEKVLVNRLQAEAWQYEKLDNQFKQQKNDMLTLTQGLTSLSTSIEQKIATIQTLKEKVDAAN